MAPKAPVDPIVAQMGKAEWTPRTGAGRPKEPNPFAAAVDKAAATIDAESGIGTPFAIPVELEGDKWEDQVKELSKVIRKLRDAGRDREPAVTVEAQYGEVDKSTKTVQLTFRARKLITRPRKDEENTEEAKADQPAA